MFLSRESLFQRLHASSFQEIRVGLFYHDVRSRLTKRHEAGNDFNAEFISRSFEEGIGKVLLSPRFHVGGSLNTQGSTSMVYGGITWQFPQGKFYFIEACLGGVLHNGHLRPGSSKHRALGSRELFREAISIGFVFVQKHTLSFTLEHISNANLASYNAGLTNIGLRYGYRF